MTEQPLLSNEEFAVMKALTEAWNLFLELPVIHEMHQQEFILHIHDAQRIVMSRPVSKQMRKAVMLKEFAK